MISRIMDKILMRTNERTPREHTPEDNLNFEQRHRKPFFEFHDDAIEDDTIIDHHQTPKNDGESSRCQLIIYILFEFIFSIIIGLPYIVISGIKDRIIKTLVKIIKRKIKFLDGVSQIIGETFQIAAALSTMFLIYMCFRNRFLLTESQEKSDKIKELFFENALFLLATHLFIKSYIKAIRQHGTGCERQQNKGFIKQVLERPNLELIASSELLGITPRYIFDLTLSEVEWRAEYKRVIEEELQQNLSSQQFNQFLSNNPLSFEHQGFSLYSGQNAKLPPSQAQLILLLGISIIKMICILMYFQIHGFLDKNTRLIVIVMSIFYINLSIVMNKTLSCQDLRRRTMMTCKLNHGISMPETDSREDFRESIDVGSSTSMKTWENARRGIFEFFIVQEPQLEICYVMLFAYYIAVTLVVIAAYGHIYFFISKDSLYLSPILIISNSFDFLFLNVLLLKRVYSGSAFNDSISESQCRIEELVGISSDLIQLYDVFFTQHGVDAELFRRITDPNTPFCLDKETQRGGGESQNSRSKERNPKRPQGVVMTPSGEDSWYRDKIERYSVYDLLVAKVKFTSEYFINNRKKLNGQVWDKSDTKQMHIEMIESLRSIFQRIHIKIGEDIKFRRYKFLGFIYLHFEELLVTMVFLALTLIPAIVPVAVEVFHT